MNDFDQLPPRDAYFSKRIRAGKRTYYFDVKATRGNDYYITITESKRKPGESEDRPFFEKHKLFLYKEDFEKFTDGLHEALDYIRQRRDAEPVSENSYTGFEKPSNHNEINTAEPVEASTNSNDAPKGFTDLEFDDLTK
jgi:hypothetical protein